MTLPKQLNTARMTDQTAARTIDNNVGNLELAIADIFGLPPDVNINAGDTMNLPLQLNMAENTAITWAGTANGIVGSDASDHVIINAGNDEVARFDANGVRVAVAVLFEADNQTYLYSPVADALAAVVGNSEIIRLTSDGIVFGGDVDTYIGLTGVNEITVTAGGNASLVIDDAGVILAQNSLVLASDTDTFLGHTGADTLAIFTANNERVVFDASGNMTINAGNLTLTSGNIAMTSGDLTLTSGSADISDDLTVDGTAFVGNMMINDTTNAFQTVGITINQGAAMDEILCLKNPNVNHGITNITETDTFARFVFHTAAGFNGLLIDGFSSNNVGAAINGSAVNPDSTDTTSSVGVVSISGVTRSGAGQGQLGASDNILTVRNGTGTRFLIKGNGDIHASDTGGFTALDEYNDAHLIRALELSRADAQGIIRSQWDSFVSYNRQTLIDAGILTADGPDGSHGLMNVSQLLRLHNGAIWQIYTQVKELEAQWRQSRGLNRLSGTWLSRMSNWLKR